MDIFAFNISRCDNSGKKVNIVLFLHELTHTWGIPDNIHGEKADKKCVMGKIESDDEFYDRVMDPNNKMYTSFWCAECRAKIATKRERKPQ